MLGGPKGREGLGIRDWTGPQCGAYHDGDVTAAKNILARGLTRLAEGTPTGSTAGVTESQAFQARE